MTQMVTVRPLQPADRGQWEALWACYNAFYGRSGPTALAEEVTAATWSRFFDAYEPVHALVAARGDELVGIAHYLFHRSTIAIAPSCYLQDLFTTEAVRGQGVGRSLINAIYAEAKAAGIPRVYWQTHETNSIAMRLYDWVAERSGFVVYGKALV
jgi:GNAT superfamily N-acetyltransferase